MGQVLFLGRLSCFVVYKWDSNESARRSGKWGQVVPQSAAPVRVDGKAVACFLRKLRVQSGWGGERGADLKTNRQEERDNRTRASASPDVLKPPVWWLNKHNSAGAEPEEFWETVHSEGK